MSKQKFNGVFNAELNVLKVDTFSAFYPLVNDHILNNKEWQASRDGKVKELIDFKTIITNPYRRCVGGYNRNINVFFLLAEAMWIFTGRKDVRFLALFNKNMEKFSDDGVVFHAPYGFRLRHWGVRSEDKFCEDNVHAAQGYDQVEDAIRIFDANPNTRQVVMSIWNPELDLGAKTKDIPCNDLVMLKIRDGKLVTTIQNRSNDLHWGLPTNIFQFSFLTEMMAGCLGIELGSQTHNSQSLHIYDWSDVAVNMQLAYKGDDSVELYGDANATEHKVDFNFSHTVPTNRLREIDYHLNLIIDTLTSYASTGEINEHATDEIKAFSKYLYVAFEYLKQYLNYKRAIAENKDAKSDKAKQVVCWIEQFNEVNDICDWDISLLARNWFYTKFDNNNAILGRL